MRKTYPCQNKQCNVAACWIYRVIHKSLRDFRPLRYSNRDGNAEGEHVNRGRGTLSFCPTLQVLDMSTLGDAADVNFGKFQDSELFFIPCLRHVSSRLPPSDKTCKYATAPSTHKKLGEILYSFICSFLLCLSWLLCGGVRKFRRDLWITLYIRILLRCTDPWTFSSQYYIPSEIRKLDRPPCRKLLVKKT
jgi:hypothetical protein